MTRGRCNHGAARCLTQGTRLAAAKRSVCSIALPARVGETVRPGPAFENDLLYDKKATGTVVDPDKRVLKEWARYLLRLTPNCTPCRYCKNKYHSRQGWYPFRSVVVQWKNHTLYHKAGDDKEYGVVLATRHQRKADEPNWDAMLSTSKRVDACLRKYAQRAGVDEKYVDQIILCEACHGHALPIDQTRWLKKSKGPKTPHEVV